MIRLKKKANIYKGKAARDVICVCFWVLYQTIKNVELVKKNIEKYFIH